jgi:hypothetical protein
MSAVGVGGRGRGRVGRHGVHRAWDRAVRAAVAGLMVGGAVVGSMAAGTARAQPAPASAKASAAPALSAHVQKDLQRHRAMAAAHEAAARCLASGQDEDACQKQLAAQCKGLALGKHCGLRHEH